MNDTKSFGNELQFTDEMLENKKYVKHLIRNQKINALNRVLDEAWNNRFWVIRFNEEWRDIYPGEYGYPHGVVKALRLRLDFNQAHSQNWVVAEPPKIDTYGAWQFEHKKKGFIIRIAEKIEAHFDNDYSRKRFDKWFSSAG